MDFLSLETKGVLAHKRPQPPFQILPAPFCFYSAQPASCLLDGQANSFPSLFSSTDLTQIQARHTMHALGCRAPLWLGSSGSVWCEVEKAGPGHRRSTLQWAPRTHLSPRPAVRLPFAKGSGIPPLVLSHKAFLVCFKEKGLYPSVVMIVQKSSAGLCGFRETCQSFCTDPPSNPSLGAFSFRSRAKCHFPYYPHSSPSVQPTIS